MKNANYPFNLIDAVFGNSEEPIAIDINGIPAWLSGLSEREQEVLKMRYEDGMTLEEIGKEYDLTRERIRQVDAKALRKLRHPSHAKHVKCISLTEHNALMEKTQEEMRALNRRYRELRAYTKKLHEAIAKEIPSLTRILSLLPEAPSSHILADIKIKDLELSVRATNCLLRAGLDTATQVEEMTLEQMKSVRNLNESCINEIRDKLIDIGFDPKF